VPTVDVRGIPTYHEIQGTGAPLLLLHGGFCSLETLRPLSDLLAPAYAVHAPERPGHGRTPDRPGPIGFTDGVLDTVAYLDAVGLDRVHVVGFSDGAIIGLMLALEHPERVASLVALSANTHPDGYLRDGSHGADERPEAADGADPERAAYAALSPDGPEHAEVVLAKLTEMWVNEPHLPPEALGAIAAPTLVVAGDRDVIDHDHTRSIARAVPGARLAIVPGSHMFVAERPAPVAALVLDFLGTGR
jgi:pimeloyl-ACP methyl ester carboxylesterase